MLHKSPISLVGSRVLTTLVSFVFFSTLFSVVCSGQTATEPRPTPSVEKDKKPTTSQNIKRWFEIDALTLSPRYRFVRSRSGVTTNNQAQYQLNVRVRFKFDKKGRYSINAGLFSGSVLNSGWNNTGVGTGDGVTNLYLKQLYFSAKPVKEVDIQFGGIGLNNGENTEITGYDNDAFLMGQRVSVKAPKHVYFDEISVANGYIGDIDKPSVFKRFNRLNESNYHQFLIRKTVNKYVSFSADYTFESGRDTLHQAIKFKLPKGNALDSLLFENYQRLDPDRGYGFGIYGDKALHKQFTLGGGFARIDKPMLNADRFPTGKRVYVNALYKFSPEFSLNGVLIQGVGPLPASSSPRTRFDLIFSYNILETLRRLKVH